MKRFPVLALVPFFLLLPAALEGQARTALTGFIASDGITGSERVLVGAALGKERGWFVGRLGLGVDISAPPPPAGDEGLRPTSGIWSTDLDGMMFLGSPAADRSLIPYLLVGIGTRGIQSDDRLGVAANYSYGLGFRTPLLFGLTLEAEGRYRTILGEIPGRELPTVGDGLELRIGLNVGWGSAPRDLAPRPMPNIPARPAGLPALSTMSADSRMRVAASTLTTAEQYLGIRYQWGGNTPREGFDCSGFIRYVFNLNGIDLPRVSRDQARYGAPVPLDLDAFQPGDILAFASNGRTVDHTAIYAGNGHIIHSSSSGGGVRYDDLRSQRGRWYLDHLVAARRVIGTQYAAGR